MCYPTAKVSCVYEIYVHRLVIEGVDTIVYAIIVRTYTAFKNKIGEEQENSSLSYKSLHKYELF